MNELTKKIEDFLMGKLSSTEHRAFEEALQQDPALATEVEQQKRTLYTIDLLGDASLKAQIKGAIAESKVPHQAKMVKFPWLRVISIAASIALLFSVYWFYLKATPEQDLFAAYYETYPITMGSRSGDNQALILEATQNYKAKNYAPTILQFEQAYQATKDTKWLLARGLVEIELGNYQAASETLQPLINQEDPLYGEQATWFSALAFLKNGDDAIAYLQLQRLAAKPAAFKHQEAKEILQQLNK